jgi:PilZ domain-containing protein
MRSEMQQRRKSNELGGERSTQRRRHIRFPLRGAVDFRWDDNAGNCQKGKGISRNISEQGIFVETLTCPPLGTRTRAEVWIQQLKDEAQSCQISLEGRVVRIESSGVRAFFGGFAMAAFEAHFSGIEKQTAEGVRN